MFFFIFTAHRGAPRPLNTPLLYPSGLEIQLAQGRWTTDSFTEPRNDAIPFFHPFSIYIFGREALQHPHEALSVQPEPCSAPALTHSCSFFVKPLVKLSKRSLTESPAAYFNLFFFFFSLLSPFSPLSPNLLAPSLEVCKAGLPFSHSSQAVCIYLHVCGYFCLLVLLVIMFSHLHRSSKSL